jgi:hypothetical protein
MFRSQDLERFLRGALECSLYVAPREPGLTTDELIEVGRRVGFADGELRDAIRDAVQHEQVKQLWGSRRLFPKPEVTWTMFHIPTDPDYRNPKAFEFVYQELREIAREVGRHAAAIGKDVLVARSRQAGLLSDDVEVAIIMLLYAGHVTEQDGAIRLAPGKENWGLPSQQIEGSKGLPIQKDERKREAYTIVKDVISRRADGRPLHAEPLDAFGEKLDQLGHQHFKMWWIQMVDESKRLEPGKNPVATLVISAALVEGALSFVVKYARSLNVGLFKSSDYDKPEKSWQINDLIKSASTANTDAILDQATQARANHLTQARQRIHAGRMISDHPAGVPDLKPDEARDAKHTAEAVVRKIIDWLELHPRSA